MTKLCNCLEFGILVNMRSYLLIFLFLFPLFTSAQSTPKRTCDLRSGSTGIAQIGMFGTQEQAFQMATSCLGAAKKAAWDSSFGLVEQAQKGVSGAVEFVKSPIATMSKMAESMKQTYGAVRDIIAQGSSFFTTLPPTVVTDLVCSMTASIATSTVLAALTAGATSVGMAARVLKYVEMIKVLSQMKALATRLGISLEQLFKTLESLNDKAREKLQALLNSKEGSRRVEMLMGSCAI
jgi:hypothetical protein